MIIREIEAKDNSDIEKIIKAIFPEFGLALRGTAYSDKETENMYESYRGERKVYYILEIDGKVKGGGGIRPLNNYDSSICELQKMYFSPEIRGKGYGKIMFNKCLDFAKRSGFDKCYLESGPELKTAIHIYEKNGFEHLKKPLGSTGHYSCNVWMIKDLDK
jgi:putative acetyltransferase